MGESFVRIEGVSRRFGDFAAVERVSLDIERGELFTLVGASGSGKTTLLRMLAGLEMPSEGRILIDGADVTRVPPYARPVNMMFQSYALFPHMTVEQNVAFGLRQDGMGRRLIRARVAEMLDLVRLEPLARRKPHQLSGGQRQRVALARSLAKQPKLLLLDEPLAALDRKLREHTRMELEAIQARVGITFVLVTHDQDEAMAMSSRIAVMEAGRILQIGRPSEVYEAPASRFVAGFIGAVNLFEGHVVGREEAGLLRIRSEAAGGDVLAAHDTPLAAGAPVAVAVRPEKMRPAEPGPADGANRATGIVTGVSYLGDVSIYHLRTAGGLQLRAQVTNVERLGQPPRQGAEITLTWSPASGVVLTA